MVRLNITAEGSSEEIFIEEMLRPHLYDSVHTAPSKRIITLIGEKKYDKVDDGIFILQEIGLDRIRQACPHFNAWLTQLENLKD